MRNILIFFCFTENRNVLIYSFYNFEKNRIFNQNFYITIMKKTITFLAFLLSFIGISAQEEINQLTYPTRRILIILIKLKVVLR